MEGIPILQPEQQTGLAPPPSSGGACSPSDSPPIADPIKGFFKGEGSLLALFLSHAINAKIAVVFPGYPQIQPHIDFLNKRECQPHLAGEQVKHHQLKLLAQGYRIKITKPDFDPLHL